MAQQRQKYNITFSKYQTGQYIQSDCSDITFINTGITNVYVNDFLLVPNASIGFTCQFNEIDTTKYLINFPTDPISEKSTNNEISVIKKIFV